MSETPTAPRPMFPPGEDERARRQELRWAILDESFDRQAVDFMGDKVQPERLATYGAPDTSINVLSTIARQLTTPGLYGTPPRVTNADLEAALMADPDGVLKASGMWTMMQHVQYIAVGMGDAIVRDDLGTAGVQHRLVEPFAVVMWSNADTPDIPVKLRELRARRHPVTEEVVWTWDEFDISGDVPRFRVLWVSAGEEIEATNLWTRVTVDGEAMMAPASGLAGDAYTWRDPDRDGEPFIPYTVYRAVDSKRLWNGNHMRSAVVGTMNSVTNFTYTGRAALDASGTSVITVNLDPVVTSRRVAPVVDQFGNEGNGGPVVSTVNLAPGAILQMMTRDDKNQHGVYPMGPGVNLDSLSTYAFGYAAQIQMAWGLSQSDILRMGNDSTSGAALAITDSGRRRFSSKVSPLFERADCERLRKIACMLKVAGVYSGATGGWAVAYAGIELSPDEQKAIREDTDWRVTNGYMSEAEAYQRVNPGVGQEAAIQAIVAARVQRAVIAAEVDKRLKALGIAPVDDPEAATDTPDDSPDDTPTR